jgi:hypothetical protein
MCGERDVIAIMIDSFFGLKSGAVILASAIFADRLGAKVYLPAPSVGGG